MRSVTVALDAALVDRLEAEAERRGVSLDQLVGQVLAGGIPASGMTSVSEPAASIVSTLDELFSAKARLGLLDSDVQDAGLVSLRSVSERLAAGAAG